MPQTGPPYVLVPFRNNGCRVYKALPPRLHSMFAAVFCGDIRQKELSQIRTRLRKPRRFRSFPPRFPFLRHPSFTFFGRPSWKSHQKRKRLWPFSKNSPAISAAANAFPAGKAQGRCSRFSRTHLCPFPQRKTCPCFPYSGNSSITQRAADSAKALHGRFFPSWSIRAAQNGSSRNISPAPIRN